MNTVDKVIHNALLRRESVVLPEIGVLVSESSPSKISGKHIATAPVWRVRFSKNPQEGALPIQTIICRELGVDKPSAQKLYERWLVEAMQSGDAVIDGVGRISRDFFTPVKSFSMLINPFSDSPVRLRGSKVRTVVRYSLVLVAVVVAAVLYFAGAGFFKLQDIAPNGDMIVGGGQPVAVPVPESVGEASVVTESGAFDVEFTTTTPESAVVAQTPATAVVQPAVVDVPKPEVATTPPSTVKPAVQQSIAKPESAPSSDVSTLVTYHIVGGVFSTSENADKCIAAVKHKNSKLPVSKIPFKGDKILVSIYSSQSGPLVDAKKEELKVDFPDIWVYKQDLRQ